MWNVRGINAAKKQQYLDWLITEQKPDIVLFNETKLTSPLYLNGYVSHQTLLRRSGGCLTLSNLKGHKKVKALGTYLKTIADQHKGRNGLLANDFVAEIRLRTAEHAQAQRAFMSTIRSELMEKAWHPARVYRLITQGIEPEDM
jgi:hypothetical protein